MRSFLSQGWVGANPGCKFQNNVDLGLCLPSNVAKTCTTSIPTAQRNRIQTLVALTHAQSRDVDTVVLILCV